MVAGVSWPKLAARPFCQDDGDPEEQQDRNVIPRTETQHDHTKQANNFDASRHVAINVAPKCRVFERFKIRPVHQQH